MPSRVRLLVRFACAALMVVASAPAGAQSPFTHRVPINVPKGANGLQPDLSLTYVPGAGNGIAGLGWQLTGIPTITRISYGDAIGNTEADTFMHSELGVLVKQVDGSYRSKKDSFVKLVPTNGCGGPCSWLAHLPSGGKVLFMSPAGGGVSREWVASNFSDGAGNYWEVWYDVRGAEGHAYPSRVVYTKGPGISTFRAVVFEYEARPDVEPSYANGSLEKVTQRLKWIRVRSGVADAYGYGGTLVRKYRFDYRGSELTGRSELIAVQEYGSNGDDAACAAIPAPATCALPAQTFEYAAESTALVGRDWGKFGNPSLLTRYRTGDFDGDGKQDVLYIETDNTLYVNLSGSTATRGLQRWGSVGGTLSTYPFNFGNQLNLDRYQLADFNGDGKTDIVYTGPDTHLWVALSTGTGFTAQQDWGVFGNGNDIVRYRFADFNGDGKTDVLWLGGDTALWVVLSTGTGFAAQQLWAVFGNGADIGRYRLADLDGDGRTDVLWLGGDTHLWVVLSTGTGFTAQQDWSPTPLFGAGNDIRRYELGDFNGDGRTDLLWEGGDTHLWVVLSTGKGFTAQQDWSPTPLFGNGGDIGRYRYGDFNGDGKTDVLWLGGDTHLWYVLSTGSGFTSQRDYGVFGNGADIGRYVIADFNGNGRADVLFIGGDAQLSMTGNEGTEPVLVRVRNGIGGTISVTYARAAEVPGVIVPPAWVNGNPAWWNANTAARLLVTKVTTEDGRGGNTSILYAYADGRVVPGFVRDQRNLGFAWTATSDAGTSQRTVTFYNQVAGLEGTPRRVETQAFNGSFYVLVRAETREFSVVQPAGTQGVEFVRVDRESVESYDPYDFVNRPQPVITAQSTVTRYDDYGNATLRTQCATTLACVDVAMTYQNDVASWLLRRPGTSTTSAGGVVLTDVKNVWSGNVITEKWEWIDTSNSWRVAKMSYDANGNLVSVTAPDAGDGIVRVTTTELDGKYRAQPAKVTNALGQSTVTVYNDGGTVASTTDVNGNVVAYTYDVFGRKRTESGPGNRYSTWEYRSYGTAGSQNNRTEVWVDAARILWREEYFDGVGFKYVVTSSGECGAGWQVENQEKDGYGRPARTTRPYCSGTTPTWTETIYDIAGRVSSVRTQSPDGVWHTTRYGYGATFVSTTDENGQVTKKYFDARNRTTAVVDAANQTTSYAYDPVGRLVSVTAPDNSVTRIFYDSLNRRKRVEEPQVAATTYAYDAVDNLRTHVARGKTITFTYDALNRVVVKQPAGETAVRYTYDEAAYTNGKGRVTTIVDASGTTHHAYTAAGEVAASTRTIDGRTYTQATTYDRAGRVTRITYPNGSHADYLYTAGGNLASVTLDGLPIAAWGGYDASGHPGSVVYGNGVETRYAYDWAEHLTSLATKSGAKVLQDLTYDWYGRPNTGGMNIGSITDRRASKIAADGSNTDETQTYTYDALYRLTQAVGVWGTKSYGYSALGNPTTFGGLTARTLSFSGQQVVAGTGLSNVTYDVSTGAMTRRVLDGVDSSFTWTVEGRLASITRNGAAIAQMTYDANGQRVKKIYTPSTGPAVTTTYATPMYEVRTFSDGSPERHTIHVFANGQLVASRTVSGSVAVAVTSPAARDQWRAQWALGSMYDPTSLEGAARKLLQVGRTIAAVEPAARWAGWALFAVAAAWVLAVTLGALRRRSRGGGLSPALRLVAAGVVLGFGVTACNAGPGGTRTSGDALISGDTLRGPPPGTYFYHRNHINSSSVVTDYLGAEASRYVYLPFGELSQPNSYGVDSATRKYTGQEHDEETGLYYYNARYYDAAIGRFLSADTVVQSLTDAQALNRYTYARNNPIIYTDPSGHSWLKKAWHKVGAWVKKVDDKLRSIPIVGKYLHTSFVWMAFVYTGGLAIAAWGTEDPQGMLRGVVTAAITAGALALSPATAGMGSVVGAFVVSATIGFGSEYSIALVNGSSKDSALEEGLKGAAISGVVGAGVEASGIRVF